MSRAENTVFISYRRSASSFIARAIFLNLREHGYDVFMDVESIDSGAFDTIILNQIAARAHFIVILSPGTAERFSEPDDWLRREIEHALDLRRNIIPVITSGFSFANEMPFFKGKLSELTRFNGINLVPEYFDAGMEKLRQRFLSLPAGLILPTPTLEQEVAQQRNQTVDEERVTEDSVKDPQKYKIFISYRRADSPYASSYIYDYLVRYFGKGSIFKDVDNIPFGEDFREYIDQVLKQCSIALVVIGPDWISPRLEQPSDTVRLEVEAVLRRNISVIPIYLQDVNGLDERQLPLSLHPLVYRNAIPVRPDPDFRNDMDRLILGIERILGKPAQ
jgi:hypothetical protein